MNFYLLFVCLAVFAIGDVLAVLTKAKLSSVFVALMLFLVGFLTGVIPPDIIEQAGLSQVARWGAGFIIFHMGTVVNLAELKREWRTVVMAIIAMAVAVLSIFLVIPIIGKDAALVSIPIVNGGIIATQIMTQAAMQKSMAMAAALGAIIYAVQKFVGTPPASFFGLKEAEKILAEYRAGKRNGAGEVVEEQVPKAPSLYDRLGLDKYFTNFTCLGVTAFFAWIAVLIGKSTGVSYSIWALFLGAAVKQLGLVPDRILDRGKASGFFNMAVFAAIIPSLAKIKIEDLSMLAFQTTVIFGAVVIGTFTLIYFLPTWKIVGSRNLAVGIATGQLLGFPATYLIANEIANAATTDEAERAVVLKKIMPAYVVSGLATVTTVSIVIAGVFASLL